ncbi:methyltransferase [bacterium]|nr:methyltransferase [bacterium]
MTLTEDSVLLYKSVDFNLGNNIIELGCEDGTMLKELSGRHKEKHFFGIDLKAKNFKEDNLVIIKGNIKNIKDLLDPHSFDIIISNPPYFRYGQGKIPKENKLLEKTDKELSLIDLLIAIKYLLHPNGFFYFTYPTSRLYEVLKIMELENIKPYKLQFRHTKMNGNADICLFTGKNRQGEIDPKVVFPILK